VIVNVHAASDRVPAGVGLKWKLTPVASPQAHSAVDTSWYFQFAEHWTSADGVLSVKSSVVLNLRSSGHVFPGMPVSRPMRCTFMVGMDHDSVLREVRGAARAGRAKARERSVDEIMSKVFL
jgi:hypothetical protein